MLGSRLDVLYDGDLSTAAVVLDAGRDDVVVVRRSRAVAATGSSGGGVDGDAMSQHGNDDAMSQDVSVVSVVSPLCP